MVLCPPPSDCGQGVHADLTPTHFPTEIVSDKLGAYQDYFKTFFSKRKAKNVCSDQEFGATKIIRKLYYFLFVCFVFVLSQLAQ